MQRPTLVEKIILEKYDTGMERMQRFDQSGNLIEERTKTGNQESLLPLPDSNSELVSIRAYASLHHRDPATVRQKILRGNLPAVKIGRNWCIRKDTPYDETETAAEKKKKRR